MAQKTISILIALLGIVLLVYMIVVESEPGALPFLMIIAGAVFYLIYRVRAQSH